MSSLLIRDNCKPIFTSVRKENEAVCGYRLEIHSLVAYKSLHIQSVIVEGLINMFSVSRPRT